MLDATKLDLTPIFSQREPALLNLAPLESGFLRGFAGGDPNRSVFDDPLSVSENIGLVFNGAVGSGVGIVKEPFAQIVDSAQVVYQMGASAIGAKVAPPVPYSNVGIAAANGMSLGSYYAGMPDAVLGAPGRMLVNGMNGNWKGFGSEAVGTIGLAGSMIGVRSASGIGTMSGVPINGAIRNVPLGFKSESQFLTASQELNDVMVAHGINDATVGVRGSSVTGFGGNPRSPSFGQPFSPTSDIDLFVQSSDVVNGFKNQPGFIHPRDMVNAYPGLNAWSQRWTDILGRPVSPAAWKPGALPNTPAILVK